ncbi:MAG: hypothetical protein AAFR61_01725 [Bacteroidota bacterium]
MTGWKPVLRSGVSPLASLSPAYGAVSPLLLGEFDRLEARVTEWRLTSRFSQSRLRDGLTSPFGEFDRLEASVTESSLTSRFS